MQSVSIPSIKISIMSNFKSTDIWNIVEIWFYKIFSSKVAQQKEKRKEKSLVVWNYR